MDSLSIPRKQRLQEIADVGLSSPALGHTLVFNGKAWVNGSPLYPLSSQSHFFLPQSNGVVPGMAANNFIQAVLIPMAVAK